MGGGAEKYGVLGVIVGRFMVDKENIISRQPGYALALCWWERGCFVGGSQRVKHETAALPGSGGPQGFVGSPASGVKLLIPRTHSCLSPPGPRKTWPGRAGLQLCLWQRGVVAA